MKNEKQMLKGSLSFGLLDQIRALNHLETASSMFILFMFVMIEIAPILTKLMSSKGPYENLILEFEKKFEGFNVPRPDYWVGIKIEPKQFEFWQQGDFRLHSREVYFQKNKVWQRKLLSP